MKSGQVIFTMDVYKSKCCGVELMLQVDQFSFSSFFIFLFLFIYLSMLFRRQIQYRFGGSACVSNLQAKMQYVPDLRRKSFVSHVH